MCGRYAMDLETDELIREFVAEGGDFRDWRPSWNVAPTTTVPVIRMRDERRVIDGVRWGLVAPSAPAFGAGAPIINARIETVATKPLFARPLAQRRCLVPARGYYEWQQTATGKTPSFIHHPDHGVAFAGIISAWIDRSAERAGGDVTRDTGSAHEPTHPGAVRLSMAIITMAATEGMREIHDRMPVFLSPDAHDDWLGDHLTVPQLLDLATASASGMADELAHYVVSRAVNSVRNDGPHLMEPIVESSDAAPDDSAGESAQPTLF